VSLTVSLYNFLTSLEVMPTSDWFSTCEQYLLKAKTKVIEIRDLLQTYETNNDPVGRISLQYSGFTYFIPLSEIQRILNQHPLSTRTKDLCNETCEDVNRILSQMEKRDVDFITQFIKSCWNRAFLFFSGQIQPTTVAKLPGRISNHDSPFANASVLVIAQAQNRSYNIDMDAGGLSVCMRIEQRKHYKVGDGRYVSFYDEAEP